MGTVRYTVVDGEVLSELRGGVKRDYVPDPLGSTVALLDSTQTITDTFSYWPYGESAGRTGTTPTPFQYVGSFGYYQDGASTSYVRARYLDKGKGRWTTEDPIGFDGGDWNIYRYVANQVITKSDPSGMQEPIEPNHTRYCGFKKHGKGKKTDPHPVDCIDTACQKHDDCMPNWCDFYKAPWCNIALCMEAKACLQRGCNSAKPPSSPEQCQYLALQIATLFCLGGLLGPIRLPDPRPPVFGPPLPPNRSRRPGIK